MQFKALRLAFEGHDDADFSMYFFLPFEIMSNIDIFLSRFSRQNFDETVEKLNNKGNWVWVDVKLPKMSFEQTFDMKEVYANLNCLISSAHIQLFLFLFKIMKEMGVKNLFFNESPDFSDFTTTCLGVDEILHSAKIDADEKGITAAAGTVQLLSHYFTNLIHSFFYLATEVGVRACCLMSDIPTFHCNRPFVFFIHDKNRNAILFSGVFRGPN